MNKCNNAFFGLLTSLFFVFMLTSGANADFTGEVVKVIDGDTIEVIA